MEEREIVFNKYTGSHFISDHTITGPCILRPVPGDVAWVGAALGGHTAVLTAIPLTPTIASATPQMLRRHQLEEEKAWAGLQKCLRVKSL